MVLLPGCPCCQACSYILPSSFEVTLSDAPSQYYTLGNNNAAYLPSHNGTYSLAKSATTYGYSYQSPDSLSILFDQTETFRPGGRRLEWNLTVVRMLRISTDDYDKPGPTTPPPESLMAASDWITQISDRGGRSGYTVRPSVPSYLVDSCNMTSPDSYRWIFQPEWRVLSGVVGSRNHIRDQTATFQSCALPLSFYHRAWLSLAHLMTNFQTANTFPFSKNDQITNGEYDWSAPAIAYVGLDITYTVGSVRAIFADGSTRDLWDNIGQTTCTPLP